MYLWLGIFFIYYINWNNGYRYLLQIAGMSYGSVVQLPPYRAVIIFLRKGSRYRAYKSTEHTSHRLNNVHLEYYLRSD